MKPIYPVYENLRLQNPWIKVNYSGARTGKGFSLAVNIKKK